MFISNEQLLENAFKKFAEKIKIICKYGVVTVDSNTGDLLFLHNDKSWKKVIDCTMKDVIEEINSEQSTTKKDDLISKQAVLDIIRKEIETTTSYSEHATQINIMFAVEELPIKSSDN